MTDDLFGFIVDALAWGTSPRSAYGIAFVLLLIVGTTGAWWYCDRQEADHCAVAVPTSGSQGRTR